MGDFDEDFATFDTVAEKLMFKRGVKPSELLKRLHKITEAASQDLPPVQVLYCGSHGGGYYCSFEFENFLEKKYKLADSLVTICALQSLSKSCDASRISDVQWLRPFGEHVMEKWPGIAKLMTAYMRNKLGHRMYCIKEIASKEKRLLEIPKIRAKIVDQILFEMEEGSNNGKKEWSSHSLSSDDQILFEMEEGSNNGKKEWSSYSLREDENYSDYAPSALKEMCKKLDGEESLLPSSIKETRDELLVHITEAQYEAMLQTVDRKFAEEVETERAKHHESGYFSASMPEEKLDSFTDAITLYGEHHYAVWQHQGLFDESAMRFLLFHPEYIEKLASEGANVDFTQKLGLCAASTKHCHLRIAEVPCLSDWTVAEYDGLEKIRLVGERPDMYRE